MSIDALFKEANDRQAAGDFAGAERRYRALAGLKPLWAWHNLGVLYFRLGRDAEAEEALRRALAADPASAPTRHTLGKVLLRQGRYGEGWPEFEARRQDMSQKITRPSLPYPEWRGEDLAGKHLVVVREQGFGDQIMLARFLPALATRAGKVTYVCSPNLVRLFQGLGAELIPASEAPPPAVADFWVPDFSLPLRLGLTRESTSGAPYLQAAPRVSGGGLGLMLAGSATNANDWHRSLPEADRSRLAPLGLDLAPERTGARDFRDTAEIVAGLDLVISVDTSVAHLAGALGKPVWVLLPGFETDWRWLTERADSPWYAGARLYRRPAAGGWGGIVEQVLRDLQAAGLARTHGQVKQK